MIEGIDTILLLIAAFLIALYPYLIRVGLPPYIRELFMNDIFRFVYLTLLMIFTFEAAPHVAIILSLIFVLTLYILNHQEMRENFDQVKNLSNKLNNGLNNTTNLIVNRTKELPEETQSYIRGYISRLMDYKDSIEKKIMNIF